MLPPGRPWAHYLISAWYIAIIKYTLHDEYSFKHFTGITSFNSYIFLGKRGPEKLSILDNDATQVAPPEGLLPQLLAESCPLAAPQGCLSNRTASTRVRPPQGDSPPMTDPCKCISALLKAPELHFMAAQLVPLPCPASIAFFFHMLGQ